MTKPRRVTAPEAPEPPPGSFSNCLVAGGVAYIAGQVARAENGELLSDEEQARQIFTKIKALVEAAGGSMSDVVKMTVFMTDIRRRDQIWKARQEFFTGDFPASTLVEVSKLISPEVTVEIEAVAVIGGGCRS